MLNRDCTFNRNLRVPACSVPGSYLQVNQILLLNQIADGLISTIARERWIDWACVLSRQCESLSSLLLSSWKTKWPQIRSDLCFITVTCFCSAKSLSSRLTNICCVAFKRSLNLWPREVQGRYDDREAFHTRPLWAPTRGWFIAVLQRFTKSFACVPCSTIKTYISCASNLAKCLFFR